MGKHIEEFLLKTTSLVRMCTEQDDCIYSGTGFFIKDNTDQLYLITNNHVIEKSNFCRLPLTLLDKRDNSIIYKDVFCRIKGYIQKHNSYDLCVVNLTHEYLDLLHKNYEPLISPLLLDNIVKEYDDFHHIEEIYVFGYPNVMINRGYNYPLVRKGITATGLCDTIDHDHREMFIMDIPGFSCSSGSPVYFINKNEEYKLVGIMTGGFHQEEYLHEKNSHKLLLMNKSL